LVGHGATLHRWRYQPRSAAYDRPHETSVADEIALPQSSWFDDKAKEPLEAEALYDARCLLLRPGVKVERGANRDERHRHELLKSIDEDVLSGSPETDPHDIGTAVGDAS
jgi:hypothetical protein